jgi:uncharacterized membrane protein required for colicin V production
VVKWNTDFITRMGGKVIVSRILVTETGFGFVFGFINHLQVVTAINYHTVSAFHATKHSTISLS